MNSPTKRREGNLIGGAVLIVIGVLALLERYVNIDFRDIWPLLLIGFGAWLIFRDRKNTPPAPTTTYLDETPAPPVTPSTDPYDPSRPINQL